MRFGMISVLDTSEYAIVQVAALFGQYPAGVFPMIPINNIIIIVTVMAIISRGLDYYVKSMLTSTSGNKNFLTWLLIGWLTAWLVICSTPKIYKPI